VAEEWLSCSANHPDRAFCAVSGRAVGCLGVDRWRLASFTSDPERADVVAGRCTDWEYV